MLTTTHTDNKIRIIKQQATRLNLILVPSKGLHK